MTAKNLDRKGNWRDQILGIHVTEKERERLESLAASEGVDKRKYVLKCLEDSRIHVFPNKRLAIKLVEQVQETYDLLIQNQDLIQTSSAEYLETVSVLEKALKNKGR